MSYIDQISDALVQVFTQAANGAPERFAGYAANRDFWISEAMHCLEVIDGYGARFTRMKEASEASDPPKYDWPTIPLSERSMDHQALSKARSRVRESAQRFLRRCVKMMPQEKDWIEENAKRLGVRLI